MTKKAVKRMIKSAKTSAKDKAMEFAERLGKPTSTGIAAGAGLGTILAAIGALKRSGEDPSESSILSNPALLGALGATGGYLAGNAFEKSPTTRSNKSISTSALLGLTGGLGTLGTLLAGDDANRALTEAKDLFDTTKARIGIPAISNAKGIKEYQPFKEERIVNNHGNRYSTLVDRRFPSQADREFFINNDLKEFNDAKDKYSRALRRAGRYDEAMQEAEYVAPKKLGRKILERIRNSKFSPVNWARSLNPVKGRALLNQIGRLFMTRKLPTRLAALALLAGGGKAVYDYASD